MNKTEARIGPMCGRAYTEPPALSRKDNATDICPDCGMLEALAAVPRQSSVPNGRQEGRRSP